MPNASLRRNRAPPSMPMSRALTGGVAAQVETAVLYSGARNRVSLSDQPYSISVLL